MPKDPRLVTEAQEVAAVARELAAAGGFALDLEFVSEDRYVPELALVQVAWGDPADPRVEAIDVLAADPRPVVELVASPQVTTVLHAGQGDLALLGHLYGFTGSALYDTQIAAAFLGLGDQLGYAAVVEALLGVKLDKAQQFTRWLDRPLAPEQVRYALDDVRYLVAAWEELRERLLSCGRLAWVARESERLAAESACRTPPEERYLRIRGRGRLNAPQLGALKALAAWRERQALETNLPPGWIAKDRSLVDAARRLPSSPKALRAVDGIGPGTVRRWGRALLQAIEEGRAAPVEPERPPRRLARQAKAQVGDLSALLAERCDAAGVARRFVACRGELESLVRWWHGGDREAEPDLPLLAGWRRELAGQALLERLSTHDG